MSYENREDIDKLIKAVDDLRYFTRLDENEQLATIKEVEEIVHSIDSKYYDSSQLYELFMNNTVPITIKFIGGDTMNAYLISEDFFNEFL